MSNPIHPEDGIVVSKAWLEEMIGKSKSELEKSTDVYERLAIRSEIITMGEVLENSQPLKPVLEVALNHGILCGISVSFFDDMRQTKEIERVKKEFLNSPIDIKCKKQ